MCAPDIDVQLGIEDASHDDEALLGDLYAPAAPGACPAEPLDEPGSFTNFLAPRLLRFLAERL